MQRLGKVLHVSHGWNIILKLQNVPRVGDTVIDENLKPVGKILDIFGPVSSPYASVKPRIKEAEKLVNKTLYTRPSKKRKEKI